MEKGIDNGNNKRGTAPLRLCWRMTHGVKFPGEGKETFLCRHARTGLRSRSMVGATLVVANRRQVKELQNGINGRVSRRSQGGGKPRPYYTRLGVPFVYSRGDPCGRPGGGARPISTILNLTPMGATLVVAR